MYRKNENLIAVYPGSFDPPTKGHIDIINRASKIFPNVVVAITYNYSKNHMFSLEERLSMMKEAVFKIKNVKVEAFSGLLVDYLNSINSFCIIRGLRALSDFEYEFQIASANEFAAKEVEISNITFDPETKFIGLMRYVSDYVDNYENIIPSNIQIELGTEKTTYEPYEKLQKIKSELINFSDIPDKTITADMIDESIFLSIPDKTITVDMLDESIIKYKRVIYIFQRII